MAGSWRGRFVQGQAPDILRKKSSAELDLRGLRVDEALSRVDEALNDAALDGAGTVRLIHGKGTGALRRAIREYLDASTKRISENRS